VPLSGAKLHTFTTGTTTDKTTYSDKALSTANPNPLTSNSAGFWEVGGSRVDVWGSGAFKFVVKDSSGTTLFTNDPVDDVITTVAASGDNAKSSVRAATTANITLSGAQTIDGVSVVAGDRVLVKDQTSADENGIYDAAASAWTRSSDLDEDADALGFWVSVREGTANGAKVFGLTTDGTITVGTTLMTIVEFGDPTAEIDDEKGSLRGINAKTDAYELVEDDKGKLVTVTNAVTKAVTITVGTHAIGDWGVVMQLGTGQVTFTAGASTTFRYHTDFNATTACRGQYSQVTWLVISATEIAMGADLDPA
jgi:uncharacterized protein YbcV (DUF1398 family)